MSKGDDLKNRLEELFSSAAIGILDLPPEARAKTPEAGPLQEVEESTSAGMFQTTFEHVAIGMVLTGTDGRFIKVNDAFCDLIGYSRQGFKGTGFQSLT